MVINLMISAKLATLRLLKINTFWNKVYDVISKILSRDSKYIANVVMWPKFGNSRISMRKVIIISILQGFDQKNHFFDRWSWFKFNNLELALGIALKFYTSVPKGLKLKVRKFWGLIRFFVELAAEKLLGGPFWASPSWIGLKFSFESKNITKCFRISHSLTQKTKKAKCHGYIV